MENEIKTKLQESGYDFKEFIKDLETKGTYELKRIYPISYTKIIYLKGKYGYPISFRKHLLSKYEVSKNTCGLTIPIIWRERTDNEVLREILYNELLNRKLINENEGLRKDVN